MDHRERAYGEVTCFSPMAMRRAIRAKIPAERTTAHAHIARLAFQARPAQSVYGFRFGEMRPAGMH